MEISDELIDRILQDNHITYRDFELTQMMVIKYMLARVLVDYYSIGYEDGKNDV